MYFSRLLLSIVPALAPCAFAQQEDINEGTVVQFVDLLNNGANYTAMIDLFTSPNATYWLNGSPARTNGQAGNATADSRISKLATFIGVFDSFSFTITSMASDGDLVLTEGTAEGVGPGTFVYLQTAVWSHRFVDGKINYMREYLDYQESVYLQSYFESYPTAPHCA